MDFYNTPIEFQILALALGTVTLVRGIQLGWRIPAVPKGAAREISRLILLARTARAGLIGLCFVGLALGWMLNVRWLTLASVVIGLEELYETSLVIAVLRKSLPAEPGNSRYETHSGQASLPLAE